MRQIDIRRSAVCSRCQATRWRMHLECRDDVGTGPDLGFTPRVNPLSPKDRRARAALLSPLFLAVACAGRPAGEPAPHPAATTHAPATSAPASTAAAAEPIRVRLLAFNDFHGNIKPPTGHVPGVKGEVGG